MIVLFWISLVVFFCVSIGAILFGLPYVPTLNRDLDMLFRELEIGEGHYLVDLGAGDGRVVLKAARYGARASGVEINPFLAIIAQMRLRKYRASARVDVGNLFHYTIPADATHIFLFTNGRFMKKLERVLVKRARTAGGLTVVSYGFRFSSLKQRERVVGPFIVYEI